MREIERMIEEINQEVTLTRHYIDRDELSASVIEAMRKVPRHKFIPDLPHSYAYDNRPAYIGHGNKRNSPACQITPLKRIS